MANLLLSASRAAGSSCDEESVRVPTGTVTPRGAGTADPRPVSFDAQFDAGIGSTPHAVSARPGDAAWPAEARANNLRLVAKGGGHSYQGTSNAPAFANYTVVHE
jgi:hypothetical protein